MGYEGELAELLSCGAKSVELSGALSVSVIIGID
jgi:hypothetical protein